MYENLLCQGKVLPMLKVSSCCFSSSFCDKFKFLKIFTYDPLLINKLPSYQTTGISTVILFKLKLDYWDVLSGHIHKQYSRLGKYVINEFLLSVNQS